MKNKLPSRSIDNTVYSGFSDFFPSQWKSWILSEYKDKQEEAQYATWRGIIEGENGKPKVVDTTYAIRWEALRENPNAEISDVFFFFSRS